MTHQSLPKKMIDTEYFMCCKKALIGVAFMCSALAYAADGINMKALKPVPNATAIRSAEIAMAERPERPYSTVVSYRLAPGTYEPLGQDENGIYFVCASGIVSVVTLKDGTEIFNRLVGGIYVKNDGKSAPAMWLVGAAAAALRGETKLTKEEAEVLTQKCDSTRTYVGGPSGRFVDITVMPMDTKSIGPSIVAGRLSTVIVNAFISSNDGRLLTPDVLMVKPVVLENSN